MDKVSCFLKGLFTSQSVITDNRIFRLHYLFTVPLLVIFGIVILCRQYLGNPINCMSHDIPTPVIDNYCWIHSTFSVEETSSKHVASEVPHPGIGTSAYKQDKIYHTYYQWIGVILMVQAILFYIPRYIWRCFDSNTINRLVLDMNCSICDQEKRNANRTVLVDYFIGSTNKHVFYSMAYFICEDLNVINVIGQICLVEAMFSNRFSSFGSQVLKFTQSDWSNLHSPMLKIFPRMAKCTFYKYGASGAIEQHDSTCILPLNALNEKLYLFLWIWFIVLAILSCMAVAYRVILYISSRLREKTLMCRDTVAKEDHIKIVLSVCNVGDWFVLDILCKNLNPVDFRDLIHDLALRIEGKHFSGL